jgi:hypothetical protein
MPSWRQYSLLHFYGECLRSSVTRSWNTVNGLLGSLLGLVWATFVPLDILSNHLGLNAIVTFVIYSLSAYVVLLTFNFFFIAPLFVWKKEWQRRSHLEARLTSKINVVYDPAIWECKRIVDFFDGHRGVSFRVQVLSQVRLHCRGLLIRLNSIKAQRDVQITPLSWATLGLEDQFKETELLPHIPQYLNVCEITDANELSVRYKSWPAGEVNIFDEPDDFLFHVLIDMGDDTPSSIHLMLRWTGDWNTAEMVKLSSE